MATNLRASAFVQAEQHLETSVYKQPLPYFPAKLVINNFVVFFLIQAHILIIFSFDTAEFFYYLLTLDISIFHTFNWLVSIIPETLGLLSTFSLVTRNQRGQCFSFISITNYVPLFVVGPIPSLVFNLLAVPSITSSFCYLPTIMQNFACFFPSLVYHIIQF